MKHAIRDTAELDESERSPLVSAETAERDKTPTYNIIYQVNVLMQQYTSNKL